MGVKVTNNAFGTLSASISTSDTTITLDSGQGARFPTLGAGDYFYGTLVDTSNNIEVVKVTARSTDSMTVTRGADNTTATAFAIGDRFELRPTAALFEDVQGAAGITSSATGTAITIDSSDDTTIENDLTVDGKVGIGTASPNTELTVSANGANGIELDNDEGAAANSARIFFSSTSGSTSIYNNGGSFWFSTGATAGSSSGTKRVEIDSSGRLTKSYQPAFVVLGDASQTLGSNYDALIYKTVRQNVGSHYSTSTGRFTAPVAGYYMITGHVCPTGHAQNNVMELFLMKNGGTGTRWFLDRLVKTAATSSNTFSVGGSCVIYLGASDYINISHVGGTSTATIEGSSVFSGYLLG